MNNSTPKSSKLFLLLLLVIFTPVIYFMSEYGKVLKSHLYGGEAKLRVLDNIHYVREVSCANRRREGKCGQNAYHLQVVRMDDLNSPFVIEVSMFAHHMIKKGDVVSISHSGNFYNPRLKMFMGNPEEESFYSQFGGLIAVLLILSFFRTKENEKA